MPIFNRSAMANIEMAPTASTRSVRGGGAYSTVADVDVEELPVAEHRTEEDTTRHHNLENFYASNDDPAASYNNSSRRQPRNTVSQDAAVPPDPVSWCQGCRAMLLLLLIMLKVALHSTSNNSSSGGSTKAPLPKAPRGPIIEAFVNNVTLTGHRIHSRGGKTPEDKALEWLVHYDPLHLWPTDDRSLDQLHVMQRYALLTLWFQSTDNVATGGPTEKDSCLWYYTTCVNLFYDDRYGFVGTVNELFLSNDRTATIVDEATQFEMGTIEVGPMHLGATIPVDFGLLGSTLELLYISNENLTGTIPSSIGDGWVLLRSFNVVQTNLSGSLPAALGRRERLEYVYVADNPSLTGTLPVSARWKELKTLRYYNNAQLTGSLPTAALAQWTLIKTLDIRNTPGLVGSLSASVGKWTNLEEFALTNTSISGSLPSSMGQWTNLTLFYLDSNPQITGTLPASIAQWTNVTTVRLIHSPNVTGTLPSTVGAAWTKLFFFELTDTGLSGTVPSRPPNQWTHLEGFRACSNPHMTVVDGSPWGCRCCDWYPGGD